MVISYSSAEESNKPHAQPLYISQRPFETMPNILSEREMGKPPEKMYMEESGSSIDCRLALSVVIEKIFTKTRENNNKRPTTMEMSSK